MLRGRNMLSSRSWRSGIMICTRSMWRLQRRRRKGRKCVGNNRTKSASMKRQAKGTRRRLKGSSPWLSSSTSGKTQPKPYFRTIRISKPSSASCLLLYRHTNNPHKTHKNWNNPVHVRTSPQTAKNPSQTTKTTRTPASTSRTPNTPPTNPSTNPRNPTRTCWIPNNSNPKRN